jgi:hypothetical protein
MDVGVYDIELGRKSMQSDHTYLSMKKKIDMHQGPEWIDFEICKNRFRLYFL